MRPALMHSVREALSKPWVLDVDASIKPAAREITLHEQLRLPNLRRRERQAGGLILSGSALTPRRLMPTLPYRYTDHCSI